MPARFGSDSKHFGAVKMAFNRPSLSDIIARIAGDIESRLPGSDARLRRSNLAVLGRANAGVTHGLYGHIDQVAKQVIVDTADGEHLERHAAVWGLSRKGAVAASGSVTFTGTNGTNIPSGTVLQRADGVQYKTTAAGAITAGAKTLPVVASVAGSDGNCATATRFTLAAQILGVAATATVTAPGITAGTDIEADDGLRDRVLFRIRKPPQGGASTDFEAWALEVPGVTRVWVYPLWLGPGTVGVFFVRDGDLTIIPDAGEVAAVQAYIDARRPVACQVSVIAPVPVPLPVTVALTPNAGDVQQAVTDELKDMIRREGQPGGTILLSHIREAISLAAGETNNVVSSPVADFTAAAGEIPVLGAVTFL